MRFLFITDVHGAIKKYRDVFDYAVGHDIKLIHLGADILPKGSGILREQKKFILGYLKDFLDRCTQQNIAVMLHFGNDDVYTRKKYLSYTQADEQTLYYDGYNFMAYGYVPDYPFGLKTACKLDSKGWKCPDAYISPPVDVGDKGFYTILDIDDYFAKKGTIADDLSVLHADDKTVVSIHCPPCGLDLDVCYGGRRVGSKAIYDWIAREQPKLVLCGHIHESPVVTGVTEAIIGKTLVVQPGQPHSNTRFVDIEVGEKIKTTYISI
jgi:uncharacterized protein